MNEYEMKYGQGKTKNIKISELHTATADFSDETIHPSVKQELSQLKQELKMDVVFVSEFTHGKRVYRYVDANEPIIAEGQGDDLENTWCKMVVDGQLPQLIPDVQNSMGHLNLPSFPVAIGTFLSSPVVLKNNEVYGTVCCFSFSFQPNVQEKDLKKLKEIAKDLAQKIDSYH